jgi:hypothetical protein
LDILVFVSECEVQHEGRATGQVLSGTGRIFMKKEKTKNKKNEINYFVFIIIDPWFYG